MNSEVFIGLIFHTLGGLAAASFYLPFKKVRNWSWETYWLVGGFFSWLFAPNLIAVVIEPKVYKIISDVPFNVLIWTYFFGVLWGIGGLTFGLSMRYLGLSLGFAVVLGFSTAFGTLLPPIYSGDILEILVSLSGQIVLIGVLICIIGISLSGSAGFLKEREVPDSENKKVIAEFNLRKGLMVAIFAGVMSASMAYGFVSGKPIGAISVEYGVAPVWQNLPVLIVILLGGLTTNIIWCLAMNYKNRSFHQYIKAINVNLNKYNLTKKYYEDKNRTSTLYWNYIFCAFSGLLWYLQFFFYGMGTTMMGDYEFSSWTLHMATVIIFGTFWGILLGEWLGTSRKTRTLVGLGVSVLIISVVIVGWGNSMGVSSAVD